MFLAAYLFLYIGVMSLFFLCFQYRFHHMILNYLSFMNKWKYFSVLYFEDIVNGRVSSLFWTTLHVEVVVRFPDILQRIRRRVSVHPQFYIQFGFYISYLWLVRRPLWSFLLLCHTSYKHGLLQADHEANPLRQKPLAIRIIPHRWLDHLGWLPQGLGQWRWSSWQCEWRHPLKTILLFIFVKIVSTTGCPFLLHQLWKGC